MTRQEAYLLIDKERANQDFNHPRDARREVMYAFSAPHVLVLEELIDKLRMEWYTSSPNLKARFVKIAASAIRALEEIQN